MVRLGSCRPLTRPTRLLAIQVWHGQNPQWKEQHVYSLVHTDVSHTSFPSFRYSYVPFNSPYYIWLGCSRSVNVSAALEAFEIDSGNSVGNYSPKSTAAITGLKRVSSSYLLEGGSGAYSEAEVSSDEATQVVPPSSAFHYHSQTVSSHPQRILTCVLIKYSR